MIKINEKFLLRIFLAIAFIASIYLIRSILAPFVFSFVIAYFLHPLVASLGKKISRLGAVSLIIGGFFIFTAAIILLLSPLIYKQSEAFILALPHYFRILVDDLYPQFSALLSEFGIKINPDLLQLIGEEKIDEKIFDFLKDFLLGIFSSSITLVNVSSLIFITPVLIFYLLKDWEVLIAKIKNYLPKNKIQSFTKIISDIDKAMSGYVRGQLWVCFILSLFYSVVLTLSGLNFGFLIGVVTGFLTFIPYIGALSGFAISLTIALFQWGFSFANIGTIIIIFVVGQILEANFLSPKLIGKNIGLHPIWMIFGLFVFGSLFGIFGVLLATPLTAVCSVLIKNLLGKYRNTLLKYD